MTIENTTHYEVQDEQQRTASKHRSEKAAIAAAKKIESSRVLMRVVSGTYKPTTVVYPAVGTTYSN